MRRLWYAAAALTLTSALTVGIGGPAHAYCSTPYKWTTPSAVKVRNGAGIPTPWDAILTASAGQWSGISGSTFRMTAVARNFNGPIYGGSVTHGASSSHRPEAPGVTLISRNGNTITSVRTIFNPRWHFNDTGSFNQSSNPPRADVRTVLVHELGHWLVLNHPSACAGAMTASEKASSMNPNFTKKWNTNADDKAGAAAKY
ncbi:matrixin family metalloprotease [Spirilliplanes yamanashiensis]|uniref:Peptidase M10 metallopeptidase domain-containing protein n=1 Tax=Spirilliplanes yamanashiensis TaxID=42233 RepID=A0A8J3YBV3_9ACTN|nr:matrixin family metalloprotease [Spirilliplanes yamanashiensis]MDP9818664.1 hypothetical protein [Spirilliplanes yamanashiensis]GIJ05120.1 hypothetical protein Sya03_44720 [Spirilliplanes yamanashiensis]